MRLSLETPTVPSAIGRAAELVDQAAASYLAGATVLEATDVTGDDWQLRFAAGIRELATPWRAADQALADARAAVLALADTDPRAAVAVARIDAVSAFVQRGYSHVGQVLMTLPQPLTQPFARMALGRIGAAGRSIHAGVADTAAAIRALAPPA